MILIEIPVLMSTGEETMCNSGEGNGGFVVVTRPGSRALGRAWQHSQRVVNAPTTPVAVSDGAWKRVSGASQWLVLGGREGCPSSPAIVSSAPRQRSRMENGLAGWAFDWRSQIPSPPFQHPKTPLLIRLNMVASCPLSLA